jgi:hypothetical protein
VKIEIKSWIAGSILFEGDELRFYCGCFKGTEQELRQYIADGYSGYAKTRTLALETVLVLIAAQNGEVSK